MTDSIHALFQSGKAVEEFPHDKEHMKAIYAAYQPLCTETDTESQILDKLFFSKQTETWISLAKLPSDMQR